MADEDRFGWLEDVEGPRALEWVRVANSVSEGELFGDPLFDRLRADALEVLEADDRIPMPTRHGDTAYNFWTDSTHRRGVLRRTSWDSYLRGMDDWDVLLDVDALGSEEGTSWVFKGHAMRRPDGRRTLIDLSPGGSDASVTREFDLVEGRFVPESEGGFVRPLSKGWVRWVDDDLAYVGHDFGPGSLTTSGYARVVRRWERGAPLEGAPAVFEAEHDDVLAGVSVETLPGHRHQLFTRAIDFYRSRRWLLRGGEMVPLDVPDDADVSVRERWLLVRLRTDWSVGGELLPSGALVAAELEAFLDGQRRFDVLFRPTPDTTLADHCWTRNHLVLTVERDVRSQLEVLSPAEGWSTRPLVGELPAWNAVAMPLESDVSDECLVLTQDFVTPPTLHLASPGGGLRVLRAAPPRFDAGGLTLTQHFATSADGTRVPYFLVGPASGDGPGPTVLTGYGGFEVSWTAEYSGVIGRMWLARGGRFAVANIRGGGEYGPAWHEAALRANRHRAYEDFEAVAADLIERSVATPRRLGIIGGSNGGLLVGNIYVRSPELLGAVVCRAPLLDMKRYTHLLAGASWMAEYGDPDVDEDWAYLRTYSPYHLIEAGRPYPPLLLTASTRDDRVHPGHARKMAAALAELGYDVSYWENVEGGHAGAADAAQQAVVSALAYTFFDRHLMRGEG
ncbi:MAG TPA: prolyl oligopeptidase family serine peptidase [Acidimicrobiales bacterium]|nr:prolyl oligopeptidase family serine peptidase [Acidimicrobiales bacterium]